MLPAPQLGRATSGCTRATTDSNRRWTHGQRAQAEPYSRASQELVAYITEYGLRKGSPFFASNNFAVSRELFVTCGGFDETFPLAGGEDREFSDRLAHDGIKFIHEPTAVVDHCHHLTLRSFLRQNFRYGRGANHYHCARAARLGHGPQPGSDALRHGFQVLR